MRSPSARIPPLPEPGELDLEPRRRKTKPPRPRGRRRWFARLLQLAALCFVACSALGAGALTGIATSLPRLDHNYAVNAAANSVLLASNGKPIATLTGDLNRLLVADADISPNLKKAVVGIEDKRFYQDNGVDYRGIARAVWQDLTSGQPAQGASTLTEQFVKNALAAEGKRTIGEKAREALLSRQLEQHWSKQDIMTHYLNTAYFGNGAYGAEAAARTYFAGGKSDVNPADRRVRNLSIGQAALMAGLIANPTAFDPAEHPEAARGRRDQVLHEMLTQGSISPQQYAAALNEPLPRPEDIHPPRTDSTEPYFSSWISQQLVDAYGPARAYGGGLQIKTSLDLDLQHAAEQTVRNDMRNAGPGSALVAIDNKTGEVRALVGGPDFERQPFNLATGAHRQPGSAFKAFTLVQAMREGISPSQTFISKPKVFNVPGSQPFVVHNDDETYTGPTTLAQATAQSDNSIFAELGLRLGPQQLGQAAQQAGVTTPVGSNPAVTLGGLQEGLTPLELAYAYSTLANQGRRVSGSLASSNMGPVGIESVRQPGRPDQANRPTTQQVFPTKVGAQVRSLLEGVVQHGTGQPAQLGSFAAGKTGTTENYYDAWFVGFNNQYTVAVWVGYPDGSRSMKRDFHGQPVTGSTYPAMIWRDFMLAVLRMRGGATPSGPTLPTTTRPTQPRTQTTTTTQRRPQTTPNRPAAPTSTQTTPSTPTSPQPSTRTQPSGGQPSQTEPQPGPLVP